MKRIGTICLLIIAMFLTSGCQKKSYLEENANQTIIEEDEGMNYDELILEDMKNSIVAYRHDTTPGKIVYISLQEMVEKIEQKDDFAVVFTTSMCGYCQTFHEIFESYHKNHHVVLYEVVLDYEDATEEENAAIIHPYFEEFRTTPGIFYVEAGKKKSYFDTYLYGIDEEIFDLWVQQNQIDRVQD